MASREQIDFLNCKIEKLLEIGLTVPEETLFFAESTYGVQPATLAISLGDQEFEGQETLLDLLFFPDFKIRLAVEPYLIEHSFSTEDVRTLVKDLNKKISSIRFILPDGDNGFYWPIEQGNLQLFIGKLYIDRNMDATLSALLLEGFTVGTALTARIIMRCRGDSLGSEKLAFLIEFVEKSSAFSDHFSELFEFCLSLIAETAEDELLPAYFLKRKQDMIKTISDIRDFEQKHEQYSMEYLMMQRYPVPHDSEDEVWRQLKMLTIITDNIFGFKPDPSILSDYQNLGIFNPQADMGKIIRSLS